MKLSVILSVRGELNTVDPCLFYLHQYLNGVDHEIIALGRDFRSGVEDCIHGYPGVRVLETPPDATPSRIWNTGLREARGDEILLMLDSVILTPNALRIMQETLRGSADIGVAAPNTNIRKYFGSAIVPYDSPESLREFTRQVEAYEDASCETLFTGATCLLTSRAALERSGLFDERFSGSGFEDIDLSMRMLMAGLRVMTAPTYVHCNPVRFTLDDANRAFFRRKWGFDPIYSTLTRTDVLNTADFKTGSPCVLDIGCSCGGTLAQIRNLNPASERYGIELNPSAASIAQNFARVEAMDAETLCRPDWLGKFDFILMSDVIEHLKEPLAALKNVAAMLKPGGLLLASIPNVIFIGNLRNMLQGKWEYTDEGILDRTHLRFFTKQSITDLLAKADLEIDSISPRRGNVTEEMADLMGHLLASGQTSVTEDELTTFQWLVRAKRAH